MMQRGLFAGLFVVLLGLAVPALAQDVNDGTLHVLRPIIHAEQEEAELCLEFDHDLDATDHSRIAAALKLESGGKGIPVKPQNISLVANLLCLPSLEHHREYRIVVTGVRGAKGEKLSSPYGVAFTVPDRQPSLNFTGEAEDEGMTRWQDKDPVLRSVNVPYVHLELYRIGDPAMMASAWRDRQQTTLAPSESATFGHDHGQAIWSGELVLGDTLNKTLEQTVPLRDAMSKAPPGLYLVVARAPEVKTRSATEAESTGLAATAAAWFLRSDLRLRALRDTAGFYGFSEKADAPAMAKDVRFFVEDANGQTLAETRSDANGVGFLPLDGDKLNNATVLIAFTDAGDADFVDLAARAVGRFMPPENDISLTMDKAFYAPASPADVTLVAHDAQGRPISESGTTLALMRSDGNITASLPVPSAASGIAHMTLPVPAVGGMWSLVWRQADNAVLARTSLRVTPNPDAPRIEMSADRAIVSRDGELNLTLKSIASDGNPAPYVAGRVFVAWMSPDILFKEWKDYRFGNGGHDVGDALPLMSFVTDEKGIVMLHLALTPPDDHALLHGVVLTVQSDAASGVAGPAPLVLPMKPKEGIVGIKPLAQDGRFPENGLARFAVIALDAEGHRRSADDLTYQIYEEGRSFDWYQAEGRWNYKPLQQKRRIGGGALALGASGEDIIEWPVAAGAYRLEITDANGVVRASTGFSAGWGMPDTTPSPSPLALTPSASSWQPGHDIQAHFTLDRPSVVIAFIGDDHIRKVIHRFSPQGENTVAFTPEKDWNNRVNLRVEAADLGLVGQITLPRAPGPQDLAKTDRSKDAALITRMIETLTIDGAFPPALRNGDSVHLSLSSGQ